jgi:hypothetical protein
MTRWGVFEQESGTTNDFDGVFFGVDIDSFQVDLPGEMTFSMDLPGVFAGDSCIKPSNRFFTLAARRGVSFCENVSGKWTSFSGEKSLGDRRGVIFGEFDIFRPGLGLPN